MELDSSEISKESDHTIEHHLRLAADRAIKSVLPKIGKTKAQPLAWDVWAQGHVLAKEKADYAKAGVLRPEELETIAGELLRLAVRMRRTP